MMYFMVWVGAAASLPVICVCARSHMLVAQYMHLNMDEA